MVYSYYSYSCTGVLLVRIITTLTTSQTLFSAPHVEQGDCSGDGVLYFDDEHVWRQFTVQAFDRGVAGTPGTISRSLPRSSNRSAKLLLAAMVPPLTDLLLYK